MTPGERQLEAPHRRGPGTRPRVVERTGILSYRATAWLLGVLPVGLSRPVLAVFTQASYLLWPTKRRWSNENFGHVLGLPPGDRRVRRLALRAYREYARYLVELMRLPSRSADEIEALAGDLDDRDVEIRRIWAESRGGGMILSAAHVANNEAIAAHIARRGFPLSVVADDTSFPELFELLKEQRAKWGVTLIPWRNLRVIYGILRRGEWLGLLIDWGYRSDGIPVRLFDAWTTLPAGPATLAARTGARILPTGTSRQPDGTFDVWWGEPIDVLSDDPAELQRASQAMADAMAESIRVAPEQWYSFKPLWPESAAEGLDLERRALAMQAGRPDPGPRRGQPRDAADQAGTAR